VSIALVGNPNCGKTTVFNALTGSNQKVGNWPGVTVAKKVGQFSVGENNFQLADLPGTYALHTEQETLSIDEKITAEYLLENPPEIIFNVVDASNLERNLFLTSQLLELERPMVVILTMSDIASQAKIIVDSEQLSSRLGCAVVEVKAHKNEGLNSLKDVLKTPLPLAKQPKLPLTQHIKQLLHKMQSEQKLTYFQAIRLLECGDVHDDLDVMLADARYQWVHELCQKIEYKSGDTGNQITAKLDRFFLNRYLGLPLFLLIMYLMFLFAINIGGAFQDFFDIISETFFVQGVAKWLEYIHSPNWLTALLANGVGKGINTTITFIPVLFALFFFLSFLEASGYMSRAAFVVDRLMRALGLPGKSFVPMIVGLGCNVPAIMATRTLDTERERLMTIIMSPFMSCSARLAIFAVFVAAFFPTGGQNIVFLLYFIGILMAVFTGYVLRKTLFKGEVSPLVIELPKYHLPGFKRLVMQSFTRLKYFITRAGKVIIPVCVLIGGLNAITIELAGVNQSILSLIAQKITPIFAPMGISQDNWPATVGLITGMLAKEVVVGTLNSLYAQMGHVAAMPSDSFSFVEGIKQAFQSIPENLSGLGHALQNPLLASAPDDNLSQSVYGIMSAKFATKYAAFSYLLFIVLYVPCVSTMAVIRQETNNRWMIFSILWSTALAYFMAVVFYQFSLSPVQTTLFVIAFIVMSMALYQLMKFFSNNRGYI
jgi:ferrous iron transport protein B